MTISTQDCKDFIAGFAEKINAVSDTWKRTSKYKESNLILREFTNKSGRTLIIAEENEKIFLYSLLTPSTVLSSNEKGNKLIGKTCTLKDVEVFIAECIKNDNSLVYEEELKDALKSSSWSAHLNWGDNNPYLGSVSEFFENDGDWQEFDLQYPDAKGETIKVNDKEIVKVFEVHMPDYDTAYRFTVFLTNNNHLLLGCNNPD